jgi:hypothetical protein
MESENIYGAKEILEFANTKKLLQNLDKSKGSLKSNVRLCIQMRCRLENQYTDMMRKDIRSMD